MPSFNMYPALEIGKYTQNRQRMGQQQQRLDIAERGMGYEGERLDIAREKMGVDQENAERERQTAMQDAMVKSLGSVMAAPEADRPNVYAAETSRLSAQHPELADKIPAYDAGQVAAWAQNAGVTPRGIKPEKSIDRIRAEERAKAEGKRAGGGGTSGKSTTAITEYKYAVANDGYTGSFTKWKKDNKSSSSVSVSVGMPGVSKSDISKETLRTVKAASGLAAASDLVKQYRTMGEGVAGVRGKIGELGGAISATGVPGVKEFGETVTKRATGVSQRQLSDLRRSGRAFIAQNVPEITAEDSGRVTKEELRITGEADKILEASSSYDEIIGALQAAVSAKYTAYHKSQYIRTGKPKFNLVAGEETQQRSEQLRFVEELLALDPDMDREVAARALQRMMTFQKLEGLDK